MFECGTPKAPGIQTHPKQREVRLSETTGEVSRPSTNSIWGAVRPRQSLSRTEDVRAIQCERGAPLPGNGESAE